MKPYFAIILDASLSIQYALRVMIIGVPETLQEKGQEPDLRQYLEETLEINENEEWVGDFVNEQDLLEVTLSFARSMNTIVDYMTLVKNNRLSK